MLAFRFCGFGTMILLGFAGMLFSGCASILTPRYTNLTADRVALPTTRIGNYLCIDARINGAGPFRLIVDTGAAGLALTMDAAKKAGLAPRSSASAPPILGQGGNIDEQVARVDRFESGGLRLNGFSTIILPQSDWEVVHQDCPSCDGILGVGPFANVLLEIDYTGNQVSVLRRGNQVYPVGAGCRYTVDEGGVPLVEAELGGRSFPFIIDTGAPNAALALPEFELRSLGSVLRFPMFKSGFSGGLGRVVFPLKRSQVMGDVRIGPVTLRNPPVETRSTAVCLIGFEVLHHWKIVLDQHERRIYFLGPELMESWAPERPPELQVRLGLYYDVAGTALRLLEVDTERNGGNAGLRKGDLITLINGEPAAVFVERIAKDNITLPEQARALRRAEAPEVHLVVGSDADAPAEPWLRADQAGNAPVDAAKPPTAIEARNAATEARKTAIEARAAANKAMREFIEAAQALNKAGAGDQKTRLKTIYDLASAQADTTAAAASAAEVKASAAEDAEAAQKNLRGGP